MTLLGMRARGWRVINLVASLGAPGERKRRRGEAEAAAEWADFELVVADQSGDPHLASFEARLARSVSRLLERLVSRPGEAPMTVVLMSPSPHDGHPRHEAVGRCAAALLTSNLVTAWWCYAIWGELALPSLYLPFDRTALMRALHLLSMYEGELSRNDYRQLVLGRARANAVLGSERVFGFGAGAASALPFAELLTELRFEAGRYVRGQGRLLDLGRPLEWAPGDDVTFWVQRPSDRSCL